MGCDSIHDPSDADIAAIEKQKKAAMRTLLKRVQKFVEDGHKGQELRLVIVSHYPEKQVDFHYNKPAISIIIPR